MADLLAMPNVEPVQGDQCQHGAEAKAGDRKTAPVKKPTGFMSTRLASLSVSVGDAKAVGGHAAAEGVDTTPSARARSHGMPPDTPVGCVKP